MNISIPPVRSGEPLPVQAIDVFTDTRDILAHACEDARKHGFTDWLICDIDAHHVETVSWHEIVEYIEDPVVRDNAMRFQKERIGAPPQLNPFAMAAREAAEYKQMGSGGPSY